MGFEQVVGALRMYETFFRTGELRTCPEGAALVRSPRPN